MYILRRREGTQQNQAVLSNQNRKPSSASPESFVISLSSSRSVDYFCNLQTFILCVELSRMRFSLANRGINRRVVVVGGGGLRFCANKAAKPQRKKKKINSVFSLLSWKIRMHFKQRYLLSSENTTSGGKSWQINKINKRVKPFLSVSFSLCACFKEHFYLDLRRPEGVFRFISFKT